MFSQELYNDAKGSVKTGKTVLPEGVHTMEITKGAEYKSGKGVWFKLEKDGNYAMYFINYKGGIEMYKLLNESAGVEFAPEVNVKKYIGKSVDVKIAHNKYTSFRKGEGENAVYEDNPQNALGLALTKQEAEAEGWTAFEKTDLEIVDMYPASETKKNNDDEFNLEDDLFSDIDLV